MPCPDTVHTTRPPAIRSALIRIGGLALIILIVSIAGYEFGWLDYQHSLQHVERIRQSHSVFAFTVGLVVVFGLGTALGLPAMPFTVLAGVLFGTALGAPLRW